MPSTPWLPPSAIRLDVPAESMAAVLAAASDLLSVVSGASANSIRDALSAAAAESGFGMGFGVAVPHAEIDGLAEPGIALVRTRAPLDVQAPDGQPADLFFVVAACPRDPVGHLQTLARVARLCQSSLIRKGLRRASSRDEAAALLAAGEDRLSPGEQPRHQSAERCLMFVSLSGEGVADRCLVGLAGAGVARVSVLEAQGLREALTREIPLFSGFRELFGDPEGQRLLVIDSPSAQADAILGVVRQACEEMRHCEAVVHRIPVGSTWVWQPPAPKGAKRR